jgi:hypothetical protein
MRTGLYVGIFVLGVAQVLSPALLAAAGSDKFGKSDFSKAPYPPSELIKGITWDWETYTNAAPGSDLWPVTWGPDDNLYVAWGDGGGFGGTDSDGRVAMGIGRIEGGPENWRGFNVNGGKNPEHAASFPKKGKTSGLLFVQGTLYASINLQDGPWPDVTHVLAWSTDKGATWTNANWVFPRGVGNFQPARFLGSAKDYSNVPAGVDPYVFMYGRRQPESGRSAKDLYITKMEISYIHNRGGHGNFPVPDSDDEPKPIFADTNGVAVAGIVYNPGIKRFLLTCYHTGPGQLGIFEGTTPTGPWSTVDYYEDWGGMGTEGEGLSCEFPQKWMSADGLTMWCIFSAYGDGAKKGIKAHDRFNLIRVRLNAEGAKEKRAGHP